MAETKAPAEGGATKVIINTRLGNLMTSKGTISQGQSIELPATEADRCLKYRGVRDAAIAVPQQAAAAAALKKENADLKEQIKTLQAQLPDSAGELEEGSEALLPDGRAGTITSIKGKNATLTLPDGNEERAKLADLKAKPKA